MNHKDLDVWKKSMDLVETIYVDLKHFQTQKIWFKSQMRRAVALIPSNIAEGSSTKRR
jgi:four helix bundle protein